MGSQKGVRISALVIALIDTAAIIYAALTGKNSGFIIIMGIVGFAGCVSLFVSGFLFSQEQRARNRENEYPSIFRVGFGLLAMYFIALTPVILFFVTFK